MNWVDVAILLALAFGAISGWVKGFVGMMLNIIGYIGAIILAVIGAAPLALWAEEQLGLGGPTRSAISGGLDALNGVNEPLTACPSSGGIADMLTGSGFPSILSKAAGAFLSGFQVRTDVADISLGGFIIQGLAHMVLLSVAFLLIFLVVKAVVWFLARGMTQALGKGVLGSLNRGMGALLGLAQNALFLSVVLGAVTVLGVLAPGNSLFRAFSQSDFAPFFISIFLYLLSLVGVA